MPPFSPEETQQMFVDLGITTADDINDLAAFLADVDPWRYTVKGTISIEEALPEEPSDVLVCSDYLPPQAAGSFSVLPSDPNALTYEVKNLPPGPSSSL